MASADYKLCDRCGVKTFYDSDLHYRDDGVAPEGAGSWAVLCESCAETHEAVVRPRRRAHRERRVK